MLFRVFRIGIIAAVAFLSLGVTHESRGDDTKKPAEKPAELTPQELEQQQRQLANRFAKLEELFIRMSELEAASNPTRAGILMQAAQLSKQLATQQRLNIASDLLAKGQFTRAIQEQEAGRENLKKLLELLQSENKASRLRDDRKKLEEVLKDIRRLESLQRAQRARTEAGQDIEEAKRDQKDLEKQTGEVEEQLGEPQKDSKDPSVDKSDANDSAESKENKESAEGKKGDEKKPDEKGKEPGKDPTKEPKEDPSGKPKQTDTPKNPDEKNPNDEGKTGDKQSMPQDSQSKESQSPESQSPDSQSKESQSKESQSQDGKSGESSEEQKSQEPQKPQSKEEEARKRVEKARKRMQEAQKQLEKEKRPEAVQEQKAAEEELQKAIVELERILKQMREEEIERSLTDLESRLRKMLELQRTVREQTEKLGGLTGEAKDRQLEIQANKLAVEQTKVVMEGQRALLLLQDEGSSLAFPEALEQVNRDAQSVKRRLEEANVGNGTLAVEDEILGALEEMLESLKQVQKKRDENKERKQQQQQQQQGGDEQTEPLVDAIAELKLIKTLQLRVNRRTQRLAADANNADDAVGQIGDTALLSELRDLASRQQKIQEVTRDILIERSKDK